MCKLKSAIILKDRVFIPDYDSHSDMLEELKIGDTASNAKRIFVRAELSPKNGDVFSDIDTWIFKVDQDIIPDWFVMEYDKKRMIEAVKEWSKNRIHIGVDNLIILECRNNYLKNCKNVTCKNSSVTAFGNSSVTAFGNSSVTAFGNSSVTALDNSSVTAWDNSSVTAWDNSSVTALENSVVTKPYYSEFENDHLILCENSTFKDCKTKTIYQNGDYKLVSVTGKDVVDGIHIK